VKLVMNTSMMRVHPTCPVAGRLNVLWITENMAVESLATSNAALSRTAVSRSSMVMRIWDAMVVESNERDGSQESRVASHESRVIARARGPEAIQPLSHGIATRAEPALSVAEGAARDDI
jgi:hypothetical protein